MTELNEQMFSIFDRDEFSFKKLKEKYNSDELAQIKSEFKSVWQTWKNVNMNVAENLPKDEFAKVHIESWTNGWNLRDHYWAAYRLISMADQSPCIGVMLDKKQLQVYLMFQHYKSEKRGDDPKKYNKLLKKVPDWSQTIDTKQGWFLWDKNEMEFADHLSLADYLSSKQKQIEFETEANKSSFLLGKFAFRKQDKVDDMERFILNTIKKLTPLYSELLNN